MTARRAFFNAGLSVVLQIEIACRQDWRVNYITLILSIVKYQTLASRSSIIVALMPKFFRVIIAFAVVFIGVVGIALPVYYIVFLIVVFVPTDQLIHRHRSRYVITLSMLATNTS